MDSPLPLRFPEADVEMAPRFKAGQDFEPEARAAALAACARFRRAVEVGAHVGLQTVRLARSFARVEAFEPQRDCFNCLADNADLPSVTVHRIAIAAAPGTGFVAKEPGPNSALGKISPIKVRDSARVAILTIDSFAWTDVDLIKVSVGHGSDAVLAGALQTIERCAPVIWISGDDVPQVSQRLDLFMSLDRLGYEAVDIPGGGLLLRPAAAERPPRYDARILTSADAPPLLVWRSAGRDILGADRRSPLDRRGMLDRQGLLGRRGVLDLTPVELASCITDQGRAVVATAPVPGRFDPQVEHMVSGNGSRDFWIEDNVIPEAAWDQILEGIACRFEGRGYLLRIPWPAAVGYRQLRVALPTPDGGHRLLLQRAVRDLGNLDRVEVCPPLSFVTRQAREVEVTLYGGKRPPFTRPFLVAPEPARFSPDLVNFYMNRGGGGNPAVRAMAEAVRGRMMYAEDGPRPVIAFVWGVLRGSMDVIRATQAANGFFYYMDHAYFARGHLSNYRITLNGFEAGPVRRRPADRLQALGLRPQPWNKSGRYILVCPPTDYFVQAHGCHGWLDETLAALRAATDREIVIRQKSKPGEPVAPLDEVLRGAHAVVTHSSNVAIEAVVAGTPVFVSATSAAAPVGLTDLSLIESPAYPDREAWLAHLAYSQFSFEEMQSGQ